MNAYAVVLISKQNPDIFKIIACFLSKEKAEDCKSTEFFRCKYIFKDDTMSSVSLHDLSNNRLDIMSIYIKT